MLLPHFLVCTPCDVPSGTESVLALFNHQDVVKMFHDFAECHMKLYKVPP